MDEEVGAGVNRITGGNANARRTFIDPDYRNFAPRIGLAYRLGNKTTVRSGYGIFYSSGQAWEGNHGRGNWPYSIGQAPGGLNATLPTNPVENVFPTTDPRLIPPSANHTAQRRERHPYVQEWNLHVQRELANDLLFEAGYVGSKGSRLPAFISVNDPPPGP